MSSVLRILLCLVVIESVWINTSVGEIIDIRCNPEICSKVTCVGPTEECKNGVEMLSTTPCNCCPKRCITYIDEGEPCTTGSSSSEPENSMCGPGLTCRASDNKATCVPYSSSERQCIEEQNQYDADRIDGTVGVFAWRPNCDSEGFYSPVRCVPGSTCHCVDKNGNRIFGEVKSEVEATSTFMDCACSRDTDFASGMVDENSPKTHCLPNGNYDILECVDQMCFCMHPLTYVKIGSTVHISNLKELPCYVGGFHNSTQGPYYKPCESRRLSLEFIVDQLLQDDVYSIGVPLPSCDLDGFYTPVQQNATHKFCSDRHGNVLENFILTSDDESLDEMTCKCARSRGLMTTLATDLPSCDKYGNFETIQCRRGICYCVDDNGIQKGNNIKILQVQSSELNCTTS